MRREFLLVTALAASLSAQNFTPVAVGHEFRQDDSPTIASCPDGSAWVTWLSFVGDRDDIAVRQFKAGKWGTLQWLPNTSGDNWLPQVGCDARNRVNVVWSQQVANNWDLYSRTLDPAKQEWGPLERLSSDPQPDINPRLASDGKGHFAAVWQGFRNGHSNIFLKTFDGERWSPEIRVTTTQANDWEPAVAFDTTGAIWVAYDTYRNGNYDIYANKILNGRPTAEMPVATGPLFEARATIAVDTANRVWIAWEEGSAGWGKDQGYTIRDEKVGVPLGGVRHPRIKCYVDGKWKTTQPDLQSAFNAPNTYQPHVFSDGKGSVWVAAKSRRNMGGPQGGNRGYWEYSLTRLETAGWSAAKIIPNSKGRSSTRIGAATLADGTLLLTWPTDNRTEAFYHRPIRQQVYASVITAPESFPESGMAARLADPAPPPTAAIALAHPNEAADLKNIRGYRTTVDNKTLQLVRGDFHRHTELSWDGGGTADGNLQDFYRYMIDAASMDFGASTDHQGGAWPYWWWYTQKMTDMYNLPGSYSPIFGYERSAHLPERASQCLLRQTLGIQSYSFQSKNGRPGLHSSSGAHRR